MKITLIQDIPKLNRTNIVDILKQINSCKSDVIVFCELSLNGYLLQDKLREDAFKLDELQELQDASKDIDIIVGAAINMHDKYFNCALYFSDGKLLNLHKKVYLPNYGMFEEARYFSSGDEFETFYTSYANVALLVCEDLWHPDTVAKLFYKKPQIIYLLAASPARGFNDDSLDIKEQWYALIKSLALHCNAKVVFVNRVGFEDGLGFWGGSCVVENNAKNLITLPLFDKEVKTVEITI